MLLTRQECAGEGGMAMAAIKLKARGGPKRQHSAALASRLYAGVWRGTSR